MSTDLKNAEQIVRGANRLLARHFTTSGTRVAAMKKNQEIVTSADIASNKFITHELKKKFPLDSIISEEAKKISSSGKSVWYIDPLDGTTNFSYGFREFAVCLARCTASGEIELGVIGLPLANEVYSVAAEGRAYLNGKAITVSGHHTHGTRNMLLLCYGHTPAKSKRFLKILERVDVKKTRLRMLASAGVELTAVASGRADGVIMNEVKPWDVLAGVLLIRAAGGQVTNFKGGDWTIADNQLVASNGRIHNELLRLTK